MHFRPPKLKVKWALKRRRCLLLCITDHFLCRTRRLKKKSGTFMQKFSVLSIWEISSQGLLLCQALLSFLVSGEGSTFYNKILFIIIPCVHFILCLLLRFIIPAYRFSQEDVKVSYASMHLLSYVTCFLRGTNTQKVWFWFSPSILYSIWEMYDYFSTLFFVPLPSCVIISKKVWWFMSEDKKLFNQVQVPPWFLSSEFEWSPVLHRWIYKNNVPISVYLSLLRAFCVCIAY